jgi:dTDP-4-dehydrorhamnose 3,5-epimerase
MKVIDTGFPGLFLLEPRVFGDERGFFLESYNKKLFAEKGITYSFIQDNHSRSVKGVIRGMHFQIPPFEQAKLVRVSRGRVLDVVLDIRINSPSFGKCYAVELDDTDLKMLMIPPGFAHGFQVLSDTCDFLYKVSSDYNPEHERGISWKDEAVVDYWRPLNADPIISEKDSKLLPWNREEIYFDEKFEVN